MGGPEIDFGIMTPDTVLLGEAKWKSPETKEQGLKKNRGQVELRIQLFDEYSRVFGEKMQFVVLGLSLAGGLVSEETKEQYGRLLVTRDKEGDVVQNIHKYIYNEFGL